MTKQNLWLVLVMITLSGIFFGPEWVWSYPRFVLDNSAGYLAGGVRDLIELNEEVVNERLAGMLSISLITLELYVVFGIFRVVSRVIGSLLGSFRKS